MITVNGKSISDEIAIGPLKYYHNTRICVEELKAQDVDEELSKYMSAHDTAVAQVSALYASSKQKLGEEAAEIFEIHKMLLSDKQFHDVIIKYITLEQFSAAYSVSKVGMALSEYFYQMEDPVIKTKAGDVLDITNRLLTILTNDLGEENTDAEDEGYILMAQDFTPSEVMALNSAKVLGFVLREGSPYSHTTILARTLKIPLLLQTDFDPLWNGKNAIIDGQGHKLIVSPSKQVAAEYAELKGELAKAQAELAELTDKPAITSSGREIALYANVNHPSELEEYKTCGAKGIGLFRSEFLYLNSRTLPDEHRQFAVYSEIGSYVGSNPAIIRTMDLGADKRMPYLGLDEEENPALGYRAIRICLTNPDMFKTQLRAVLKASCNANIGIMFPMIASVWELREAKKLLEECKEELKREKIPFGNPEIGVMIETPAAVMIADDLAKEVSFLSIGTNDLAQYALALDRNNAKLDRFYDSKHPAVLKMIKMTIDAGHKAGCRVCICGELAGDLSLTETFVDMGIDSLSVSQDRILPLKKLIRSL